MQDGRKASKCTIVKNKMFKYGYYKDVGTLNLFIQIHCIFTI